jgi:hypothetical protein
MKEYFARGSIDDLKEKDCANKEEVNRWMN